MTPAPGQRWRERDSRYHRIVEVESVDMDAVLLRDQHLWGPFKPVAPGVVTVRNIENRERWPRWDGGEHMGEPKAIGRRSKIRLDVFMRRFVRLEEQ